MRIIKTFEQHINESDFRPPIGITNAPWSTFEEIKNIILNDASRLPNFDIDEYAKRISKTLGRYSQESRNQFWNAISVIKLELEKK